MYGDIKLGLFNGRPVLSNGGETERKRVEKDGTANPNEWGKRRLGRGAGAMACLLVTGRFCWADENYRALY